jgi:tetratricopeptide (TPR) repeat protein
VETNEKWIAEAENLMWQKPDSALTILNRVDTSALDKHLKAAYTLLYTQALDKTDADVANRSELFGLKEYFDRAGIWNYAALAAFYEGRIYQERKDNERALGAFLGATAYEDRTSDHRLKGLIRVNMGFLNYIESDYTEALINLQKAYDFFYLAGEAKYQIRALLYSGNTDFHVF